MRIAKMIARSGLCSRREAEKWIKLGRVTVNGEPATFLPVDLAASDMIAVDGEPLPQPNPPKLWRYHKPVGLLTTSRDPAGRPTIFDHIANLPKHVMPVGRLDLNSEGLLLLTNCGDLARSLELPANGWARAYRVRTYGTISERLVPALKKGPTINGVRYAPIETTIDPSSTGKNDWLTLTLTEGRNREIRVVLSHFGLQVSRLIRVAYGPFQLGDLKKNHIGEVPRKKLKTLLRV